MKKVNYKSTLLLRAFTVKKSMMNQQLIVIFYYGVTAVFPKRASLNKLIFTRPYSVTLFNIYFVPQGKLKIQVLYSTKTILC